uniref:Uncharacterized protein n=1 Tax=Oryza punctata TaxID=4537 RepID=A0A0E0M8K3_ORYPU
MNFQEPFLQALLLSGKIPTGNQLQTLTDPSIYSNNSGLCGLPLNISCTNYSLASDERYCRTCEEQYLSYCVMAGVVFGFWLCWDLKSKKNVIGRDLKKQRTASLMTVIDLQSNSLYTETPK